MIKAIKMLIDRDSLPSSKLESWKYTNLARIYDKNGITELFNKNQSTKENIDTLGVDYEENALVIINGTSIIDSNNKLSDDDFKFSEDSREMSKLAIENSKLLSINIPKNSKDSLNLVFINTENAQNKLTNIALKLNVSMFAELDLNISFNNLTTQSAINLFLDINLADSAKVNFTNSSNNDDNLNLLTTANYLVNLDKNAEFNGFNLLNKDALLRNDFVVNLNKEGSRFDVRGLYLLNHQALANVCFLVNHNASNTYSNVNFRGVVNGNAKAWFNAKAVINEGIKQIQTFQNNKNIQLSNKAEINTKPELVIYSDDVVCTHGATIGQLDENALFYLQSRGLSLIDAKHLLLQSFVKSQLASDDFPFNNIARDNILKSLDNTLSFII